MQKRKIITAHINDTDETTLVNLPADFCREPTAGHREIGPGIIRIGHHTGRRWGVVRDYSIWLRRNGTVHGDDYTAYDLASHAGRCAYARILATAHDTDTTSGRSLHWRWLLDGVCSRAATADERRRLEYAGYSAVDAALAWCYAETQNGARLYYINGCGWAVEGETGDIVADLDAEEAINQWQ